MEMMVEDDGKEASTSCSKFPLGERGEKPSPLMPLSPLLRNNEVLP